MKIWHSFMISAVILGIFIITLYLYINYKTAVDSTPDSPTPTIYIGQ